MTQQRRAREKVARKLDGRIYVAHFNKPIGPEGDPRKQAGHYLGWTQRTTEERLADHAQRRIPRGPQPYTDFERAVFLADASAAAVGTARAAHRDALDVVQSRRADWTDARRRVAALERLEDRRRAEHATSVQRAEDQLVDDLVVARHARGDRT